MHFDPELPFQPSAPYRAGVLLINLGTPDALTARAVRRYLAEFLSDSRVVEIPTLAWQIILRLLILPFRSHASARKYATIWTAEGSPLRVHTARQAESLRQWLAANNDRVLVDYAMRYGAPSIGHVLNLFKRAGVERVLLVPMYPQYASSTSATAFDAAFAALKRMRNQLEIRTVKQYSDHPGYIGALAAQVKNYWQQHGRPDFAAGDQLLLSFHGMPKRTMVLGDPYFSQCRQSATLLAHALGLTEAQCQLTFQSRFGRAQWLQPYTASTLKALGSAGVKRVDVFCPGFIADCLETLEEIGIEGRELFLRAGGNEYHFIPCVNSTDAWVGALGEIVVTNLQGW